MSEDNLPCADKLVFNTRQEAEKGATVTKWHYGTKLKAYHCRHCNLWHLASDYEN